MQVLLRRSSSHPHLQSFQNHTHTHKKKKKKKKEKVHILTNFFKNVKAPKVKIAKIQGYEYGLIATEDINEDEIIAEIPEEHLLNFKSAMNSSISSTLKEIEGLDEGTMILLFLIHQRFVEKDSHWKPYFDSFGKIETLLDVDVNQVQSLFDSGLMLDVIQLREHMFSVGFKEKIKMKNNEK